MGSEHSAQSNASAKRPLDTNSGNFTNLRRQHTIANPGAPHTEFESEGAVGRPRSTSPGPSLCSDVDLPYISYTVNRPIGDSPKLQNKQLLKSKSVPRKIQQKQMKKIQHSIVLVNPAQSGPNIDKDPDIMRLQSIPMFLPIMRATLNLPAARDPEVLERLDPAPLHRLCTRYQNHLKTCANLVATEQNALSTRVRETDNEINRIFNIATEKQRKYAKYAEKLCKVQELSSQLNKCHMLLNQILESMETLNNHLDVEDRLEPFVWTTG
ncbi:hypothetical protein HHI36_021053 [Cryptolaemus montrouzieri]|uniref:BLOC-1-related complex subunit 5 n=1 Tax=Cryptolaemus montrouzieri TaxID=559131 RepID=A0ABD2MVL7_9CUCU